MQKLYTIAKALSRAQKHIILLVLDAVLIPLALIGMLALTLPSFTLIDISNQIAPAVPSMVLLAMTLSWMLCLPQVRLAAYEARAVGQTAKLTLALMAALWGLSIISPLQGDMRNIVIFGLIYFIASVTTRMVLLQLLNAIYSYGKGHKNVLIYGAGTTGAQLAQALKLHDNITPIAFIDDIQSHFFEGAGNPYLLGIWQRWHGQ